MVQGWHWWQIHIHVQCSSWGGKECIASETRGKTVRLETLIMSEWEALKALGVESV